MVDAPRTVSYIVPLSATTQPVQQLLETIMDTAAEAVLWAFGKRHGRVVRIDFQHVDEVRFNSAVG